MFLSFWERRGIPVPDLSARRWDWVLRYLYHNKWCAKLWFKFQVCDTFYLSFPVFPICWINNPGPPALLLLKCNDSGPVYSLGVCILSKPQWKCSGRMGFNSFGPLLCYHPPDRQKFGLALSDRPATLEVEEAGERHMTWPQARFCKLYFQGESDLASESKTLHWKTHWAKAKEKETLALTPKVNSQCRIQCSGAILLNQSAAFQSPPLLSLKALSSFGFWDTTLMLPPSLPHCSLVVLSQSKVLVSVLMSGFLISECLRAQDLVLVFSLPHHSSILNIHWKGWWWSWSSNTLATWWEELTHWKGPWYWERLKAGGEGNDGGWDVLMASLTQWTWAWANFRRWWRTGKAVHRVAKNQTWLSGWTTFLSLSVLSSTCVVLNTFW